MKIFKIFLAAAVAANLLTTVVFSAPSPSTPANPVKTEQGNSQNKEDKDLAHEHKKCRKRKCKEEFTDPIKSLENRKESILKLEKEGKLSKEEADKKIKKIESRIKGIEEFNKLTVEQKREKLIGKFKEVMDTQIKEGKISKEKADELISEYTKKIQEWDGKGMPRFYHKKHDNADKK